MPTRRGSTAYNSTAHNVHQCPVAKLDIYPIRWTSNTWAYFGVRVCAGVAHNSSTHLVQWTFVCKRQNRNEKPSGSSTGPVPCRPCFFCILWGNKKTATLHGTRKCPRADLYLGPKKEIKTGKTLHFGQKTARNRKKWSVSQLQRATHPLT